MKQSISRKMSLVIGARRHLEWGHEKYIMDTIQNHPAQVIILLLLSSFIEKILFFRTIYMVMYVFLYSFRSLLLLLFFASNKLLFGCVDYHSPFFLFSCQAALGGAVGNLQRVRAFLRVRLNYCYLTWTCIPGLVHCDCLCLWKIIFFLFILSFCADSIEGLWSSGF